MSKYEQSGWVETDSTDNGTATATKAAASGKQHIIYSVSASFTSTVAKLLTIKDGNTTIANHVVYDSANIEFPRGIAGTVGNAVSAVLAASGSGSNFGYVILHGNTI